MFGYTPNIAINKETGTIVKLDTFSYNCHIPYIDNDMSQDGLYTGYGSGIVHFHVYSGEVYTIRSWLPWTGRAWESNKFYYVNDLAYN